MSFLCRYISEFLGTVVGIIINFFATAVQGLFYLIFKFASIENPDIFKSEVLPDKVKYFLYTKNSPEHYVEIDPMHPDLLNNPNVKIVFIIHGWMNSREIQWYEQVTKAFLQRNEEFYVVQVDWNIPARSFYALASWNTKDVGHLVGKFIVGLHRDYSVPLDNFLIVGHSLGAQVAGYAGKKVLQLTQRKLTRIVGLDPAGPLFNTRPKSEQLNRDDAEVVQVIHTDGDTFGHKDGLDALDFFPNGGDYQPRRSKIALFSLIGQLKYSHEASAWYFANAIANPDAFIGTKCTSWKNYLKGKCANGLKVSMGDLEANARGNFYLETNEK